MSAAVERPVEVELKYRVVDLAAAERYLVAEEIGSFSGTAAAALVAVRGPLRRHRRRGAGAGRLRGPPPPVRARARSSRSSRWPGPRAPGGAVRREELEGPADRTAGPLEWPASDARSLVLELAGDAPLVELVTIRQLRRKRDRPRRRHAGRAEPRRGRRRLAVARRRPLRRARGGAGQGRRGAADGAGRGLRRGSGAGAGERQQARGGDGRGPDRARAGTARRMPRTESTTARRTPMTRPARRRDGAAGATGEAPRVRRGRASPPSTEPIRRASAPTSSDVVDEAVEEATRPTRASSSARRPGVTADDHVAEAGRKVMRFHLARMLAREAGTREGTDPEELHAMRVATRRQRAAWRVFGASFRPGRTKRYRNGLREIASRLGAVRDLDVLLEAADLYRADLPVVGAARARAAPVRLARAPRRRPGPAHPRARLGRLPALGRRLPRLRPDRGRRGRAGRCRPSRTASATRRRRGSGPPTSRSAATSPSCAGPTSRRSTSCGSPASGCATRSSSCARRSATTPRR